MAPSCWATTTGQHERGSVSRLDGSCSPGQHPIHINEAEADSVPVSGPSLSRINAKPGRGMLYQIKPAVASGSLSSTFKITSSHPTKRCAHNLTNLNDSPLIYRVCQRGSRRETTTVLV